MNVGWFFLSHRLPVALAAKRAGYDVHVACGVDAEEEARTIRSYGIEFHRLSLQRANRSPLSELRVLRELLRLYRSVDPQVVHHVTINRCSTAG
ncbi:MAG: glycosyltransferase [Steroidobacteraceae bacterium]